MQAEPLVYLLDTNVVSELRKKARANRGVKAFFRHAMKDDRALYLSVVSVGELRRGVEIMRYRGDVAQASALESWLTAMLASFGETILPIDDQVCQVLGRLRVPHPEHALDKLIAATALIHDLTLVTRNALDFDRTGVRLLNPFE
jgi:predicted nucleic acid-binding protein